MALAESSRSLAFVGTVTTDVVLRAHPRPSRHVAPGLHHTFLIGRPVEDFLRPLAVLLPHLGHDFLSVTAEVLRNWHFCLSGPEFRSRASPSDPLSSPVGTRIGATPERDRKSTRLNSSHSQISY